MSPQLISQWENSVLSKRSQIPGDFQICIYLNRSFKTKYYKVLSKDNTPELWVFLLPYSASVFFQFYHLETQVVLELCVLLRLSANQNSYGATISLVTLSISVGYLFLVCFSDCYSGLSLCSYYHNPKTALYAKKFVSIFLCASFRIYLHHVPRHCFALSLGDL